MIEEHYTIGINEEHASNLCRLQSIKVDILRMGWVRAFVACMWLEVLRCVWTLIIGPMPCAGECIDFRYLWQAVRL